MNIQIQTHSLSKQQELVINKFLASHPHNTIFQSPDFYNFYLSLKNYDPYYFLLYNDSEAIEGVLLAVTIYEGNGLVSQWIKRCVIQGGPIVKDDNSEFIALLLKSLNKTLGKKTLITQFRNYRLWDEKAIKVFSENGFDLHNHLNLITKYLTKEEILRGMSSSRLRQLKKGLESGAMIRPAANLEEVKDLYHILYSLYRNKVRKPLPKWPFFEQFYEQLVPAGKGIIMLVIFKEKIIGGIVSPVTPGKIMYELYICGLDKEYPQQHPSILATWAALEWATKNNIPAFDFLGLGKPEIPYGVRDFKLRFGGEQVNYGRFGRRNYHIMYKIAELGYKVMRGMRRG